MVRMIIPVTGWPCTVVRTITSNTNCIDDMFNCVVICIVQPHQKFSTEHQYYPSFDIVCIAGYIYTYC
jgi:hypothetical protein